MLKGRVTGLENQIEMLIDQMHALAKALGYEWRHSDSRWQRKKSRRASDRYA
jgi:hypothetical protein